MIIDGERRLSAAKALYRDMRKTTGSVVSQGLEVIQAETDPNHIERVRSLPEGVRFPKLSPLYRKVRAAKYTNPLDSGVLMQGYNEVLATEVSAYTESVPVPHSIERRTNKTIGVVYHYPLPGQSTYSTYGEVAVSGNGEVDILDIDKQRKYPLITPDQEIPLLDLSQRFLEDFVIVEFVADTFKQAHGAELDPNLKLMQHLLDWQQDIGLEGIQVANVVRPLYPTPNPEVDF